MFFFQALVRFFFNSKQETLYNVIMSLISGTVFSGMFCLCIGKPRFSQNDNLRTRFGSFIINIIIGVGQLFTVLFCLVGWGWSIWWGVIMLKVASKLLILKKSYHLLLTIFFITKLEKHEKFRMIEESQMENVTTTAAPVVNQNHMDPERGVAS